MAKNSKLLSPKEEAFCQAYADPESPTCGQATLSAIKASYGKKGAPSAGWIVKQRPRVIARCQQIYEQCAWTPEKVMTDLEHVRLRALEKGDLVAAARCSELQGKHLGMFTERTLAPMELPQRQRGMDEATRAEAAQIAPTRLDRTGNASRLPADVTIPWPGGNDGNDGCG